MIIGSHIFENILVWPIFQWFLFRSMNFSSNRKCYGCFSIKWQNAWIIENETHSKTCFRFDGNFGNTHNLHSSFIDDLNYIIDLISWDPKIISSSVNTAVWFIFNIYSLFDCDVISKLIPLTHLCSVIHEFFRRSHSKIHHFGCLMMMMILLPDAQIKLYTNECEH